METKREQAINNQYCRLRDDERPVWGWLPTFCGAAVLDAFWAEVDRS